MRPMDAQVMGNLFALFFKGKSGFAIITWNNPKK